jgi:hypothetical protein
MLTIFVIGLLLGIVVGAIYADNEAKRPRVKRNSRYAAFCEKHPSYQ